MFTADPVPALTPADIRLVKDSFRKIVPIGEQVAALFYARLFELDPALRTLFRGEMSEQGRRLMAFIATAVASLEESDRLLAETRALGARHAGYGAREAHYVTVGVALLWTLEKGLAGDFTAEVRSAWSRTYAFLASTMIEAARHVRSAAA